MHLGGLPLQLQLSVKIWMPAFGEDQSIPSPNKPSWAAGIATGTVATGIATYPAPLMKSAYKRLWYA